MDASNCDVPFDDGAIADVHSKLGYMSHTAIKKAIEASKVVPLCRTCGLNRTTWLMLMNCTSRNWWMDLVALK